MALRGFAQSEVCVTGVLASVCGVRVARRI